MTESQDSVAGYTVTVLDHGIRPRNLGEIDKADGYAKITGPCGDTIEVWVTVKNDIVTDIRFMTDGCITSLASGSMATTLAKGKSIAKALGFSQQDILEALGGLPEDSEHCALLASNTLRAAIKDYLTIKDNPWKKLYRTY